MQNKIIKKRANVLAAEDALKTNDTINYLNLLESEQITKIHLLNKRYSKLNWINVNIYIYIYIRLKIKPNSVRIRF